MKKIKVKNLFALVDNDIFYKISKTGWWLNSHGYAVRQLHVNGKRKNTYLHHLVLKPTKPFEVDHINRNKLDNRRSNLRLVTRTQNILNLGLKKNNTSGHKGVSWAKNKNGWRSYIGGSKKRIELGLFKNKKDAIKARKEAEKLWN